VLVGIVVCVAYVAILLGLQKASGVRYDQITDSAETMRKGIVVPVAVCTALLVAFAAATGRLADAFTYAPRAASVWLWAVPAVIVLGIVLRLVRAPWSSAGAAYIGWALVGTALVGFSEELLVRGILVDLVQADDRAPVVVALITSVVFGLLHGANVVNGQDARTTAIQVVATTITGFALFACLAVSGTLWLPIALHFLYDFSLVIQGQVNKVDERQSPVETVVILLTYVLSVASLFLLAP
jgi:membrane protease YdiL (CAAX protease family)